MAGMAVSASTAHDVAKAAMRRRPEILNMAFSPITIRTLTVGQTAPFACLTFGRARNDIFDSGKSKLFVEINRG